MKTIFPIRNLSSRMLARLSSNPYSLIVILAGLIAINLNLHAQRKFFDNYEIGLSGSAGLSALSFTMDNGTKPSYSMGYAFGWDVALLFTEQWAFRTGVNMTSYNTLVSLKRMETRNIINADTELPNESHLFMLTEFNNYEELHEVLYLRFPLMAQYRMPTGKNKHFYASAGFMVSFLANSAYRINFDNLITKGYSEYTMIFYDGMPEYGFNTYSKIKTANKPDLGLSLSGTLETGMRWMFNNGTALYAGLFIDYGLNDIRKSAPMNESIVYNKAGEHTFNTIINSQNDGKPMTDKVLPVAVGLRLRWSMMFRR